MLTAFSRITKYGLQTFLRNGWVSAATIVVMILALLVFHFLIIFDVVAGRVIAELHNKIDIAVYFKSTAPENSILELQKALEDLAEIKSVEYISQAKALEVFKERHQNDPTIRQALEEIGENPLLASLNVKAKDTEKYQDIAAYLENENLASIVDKVTYNQNRSAIDRLASIAGTLQKLGVALTLFLAIMAVLVTFNTIRLAIYSNREEIGIMRLVGANNIFISGPFVVSGILYGVIAAFVSLIIAAPLVFAAAPYAGVLIPELNLKEYFAGNLAPLFVYQLAFGIFLGVVSSFFAARRYLKI